MLSRTQLTLGGLIALSISIVGCCNNFTDFFNKMADAAPVSVGSEESSSANSTEPTELTEHARLDRCITCFNDALQINKSGNRYLRYLRGKEPSKKRVPSILTPPSGVVKQCNEALGDKQPPLADIDRTLPPFIESVSKMAPLLKQMRDYYSTREYETDGFAKGKTFHETFKVEFEKYRKTLEQFEKALDVALDKKDKEQIAAASKNQNLYYHFLVFQYDAKQFVNEITKDSPDTAEIDKLKTAVDTSFRKLNEYANEHSEEVEKATLYPFYKSHSQTFIGQVRTMKKAKPTAEQAARIQDSYNQMIDNSNKIRWN